MMARIFVGLAAALAPVQAVALSCVPWHLEDAWNQAQSSDDPYFVILGVLTFDAADLPQVDFSNQDAVPERTEIDARLVGKGLQQDGFSAEVETPVRVVVQCAGPWCPKPEPGIEYLLFAREAGDALEISFNACGGMAFAKPAPELFERLDACISADTPCAPPDL